MQNKKFKIYLYVAGIVPDPDDSLASFIGILNHKFNNNYSLEIIDILQNPEKAIIANIIATPTLVKEYPKPIKKIIMDFSSKTKMEFLIDLILHDR